MTLITNKWSDYGPNSRILSNFTPSIVNYIEGKNKRTNVPNNIEIVCMIWYYIGTNVCKRTEAVHMEEQKQELHEIIDSTTNPKLVNYILHLIKIFLELRS